MKRKLLFTILSLSFALLLSSCGSINAPSYIRGTLDSLRTGVVSEELVSQSVESEDELKQGLEEGYDELYAQIIASVGEEYSSDNFKKSVKECVKNYFQTIKYEVSDDCELKNDEYTVSVTIYPSLVMDTYIQTAIEDFNDEWNSKSSNYSSQKELYKDYYVAYYDNLNKYLKDENNWSYGEPEEYTVRVSKSDSGLYEANSSDMNKMCSRLFSASF